MHTFAKRGGGALCTAEGCFRKQANKKHKLCNRCFNNLHRVCANYGCECAVSNIKLQLCSQCYSRFYGGRKSVPTKNYKFKIGEERSRADGAVEVRCLKQTKAGKNKHYWVLKHRMVMNERLLKTRGDGLKGYESVYHINGDKQDNRLENLNITTRGLAGSIGTKSKAKDGYVQIRVDGYKQPWIAEHRYVMDQHLRKTRGFPLLKSEHVHHINAQRDDNRLENLELWTGNHPSGARFSDHEEFVIRWIKTYGNPVDRNPLLADVLDPFT